MNKMLIVDDDWNISDSLRTMDEWIQMNIDVVGTAGNGKEAVYWLENESVDIVLTDIIMPHMNGLELAKWIQERQPSVRVIIMSGYEDFTYAQEAIRHDAKAYVLKPIDADELFEAIKKVQQEKEPTAVQGNQDLLNRTAQERIIIGTKSYIQQNYMHPLSLKELSERVHLSEHYLGQLFKNINGESFLTYLTKVRMEKACDLLKNPTLKNYEISEQVGYADPKHFTKVFKRRYGCTPREYRKKYFPS